MQTQTRHAVDKDYPYPMGLPSPSTFKSATIASMVQEAQLKHKTPQNNTRYPVYSARSRDGTNAEARLVNGRFPKAAPSEHDPAFEGIKAAQNFSHFMATRRIQSAPASRPFGYTKNTFNTFEAAAIAAAGTRPNTAKSESKYVLGATSSGNIHTRHQLANYGTLSSVYTIAGPPPQLPGKKPEQ